MNSTSNLLTSYLLLRNETISDINQSKTIRYKQYDKLH